MVSLQIGSRINVPHMSTQGVVMARHVHLVGAHVVLRFIGAAGAVIDCTFTEAAVEKANPPPIDVAALTLERDQLHDRVQEMQRKFAQRAARKAAKSKKRK